MALVGKPEEKGCLYNGTGFQQCVDSLFYPGLQLIDMRRHTDNLAENPVNIIRADVRFGREGFQCDGILEMGVNIGPRFACQADAGFRYGNCIYRIREAPNKLSKNSKDVVPPPFPVINILQHIN